MIAWPWLWPGTGPAMTRSEYDRRLAEAGGMAEVCVRVIPDPGRADLVLEAAVAADHAAYPDLLSPVRCTGSVLGAPYRELEAG